MVEKTDIQQPKENSANNAFEHFKKTEGNFYFQMAMYKALSEIADDIPGLRVLDYGAGALPSTITVFSSLRPDQKTTAYDPSLPESTFKKMDKLAGNGISWVKELPKDQEFDLAVCHFSLHHFDKPPQQALQELESHKTKYTAIIDYDYSQTTLDEFKQTFISEAEQKELQEVYDGDWEACFAAHSQYGIADYESAMQENGLTILKKEVGSQVAKNKFFLIGQAA